MGQAEEPRLPWPVPVPPPPLQAISWAARAPGNLATQRDVADAPVPPEGVQALAAALDHDHPEARQSAARALALLAGRYPAVHPALLEAAGAAALMRQLHSGVADVQKWAAGALGALLSQRECPPAVGPAAPPLRDASAPPDTEHATATPALLGPWRAAACAAVPSIVAALVGLVGHEGAAEAARAHAARALGRIAGASAAHAAAVAAAGAAGPLVGLLRRSRCWGSRTAAATSVARLAAAPGQCRGLVAAGALPALVQQLPVRGQLEETYLRRHGDLAISAISALWAVVRADAGAHATAVVDAGAVAPLVHVLTRSPLAPERARVRAAQALALLMYRADGAAAALDARLLRTLARHKWRGTECPVWPHVALGLGLAAAGPANAARLVGAGTVQALAEVLRGRDWGLGCDDPVQRGMAAQALHACAGVPAMQPLLVAAGVVPVLAAALQSPRFDPGLDLSPLVAPGPVPRHSPDNAVGYPPTAVGYTPTAVGYPPTAVGYPPTAVGYPPTAVSYPPTAPCPGTGTCSNSAPRCDAHPGSTGSPISPPDPRLEPRPVSPADLRLHSDTGHALGSGPEAAGPDRALHPELVAVVHRVARHPPTVAEGAPRSWANTHPVGATGMPSSTTVGSLMVVDAPAQATKDASHSRATAVSARDLDGNMRHASPNPLLSASSARSAHGRTAASATGRIPDMSPTHIVTSALTHTHTQARGGHCFDGQHHASQSIAVCSRRLAHSGAPARELEHAYTRGLQDAVGMQDCT